MRKIISLIINIIICLNIKCQTTESDYTLSNEKIEEKHQLLFNFSNARGKLNIIGLTKDSLILLEKDRIIYSYNEKKLEIKPYIKVLDFNNCKAINILAYNDIIFQVGFLKLSEQYKDIPIDKIPIEKFEYQDFWIQYKEKNIRIDSFPYHYIDKYIRCVFSDDGKKLICNPYTSVTPGYSPESDNRIYLYDLQEIVNGKIDKRIITCERCMNAFIVNNNYYFNKEVPIGHGFDGFYNNIYKAPLNNINDTNMIAHNIELINITPDGRFILGGKYLHGKYTLVILNVETKKYQYILGRNYPIDNCYYSFKEKKFAFDFGKHIVYIEFPKEYPFDALENTFFKFFKQYTKEQDKAFWEKHTHNPF